ncbi:MAG TPA: hypothetical protein VFU55_09335 [Terracidiphilus sp.]|nr:hypothetical protein [Terracidiphilus sp.]
MKRRIPQRILSAAVAVLAVAFALRCAAQDRGYWRAESETATRITGDIYLSGTRLNINFLAFPLVQVRRLTPAETGAAFDADVNTDPSGTLYRLNIPAGRRLLHHNTLCGTEDTEWMATYVSGKTLQVAFFSGDTQPVFTMAALPNSMTLCGSFSYFR